jgi:hypothetical protein
VHSEATNLDWEGDTREATVARTGAALQAAQNHAEKLRAAAQSARDEASNLTSLAGDLGHAADKAGEDGYNVSDMYAVTDKQPPSADPTVAAARQMITGQHESNIISALAKFVVHDTKVGTDLASRGAQIQPNGPVQCFGPEQHTYCVEQLPDGSLATFPGIPAMGGQWPDAASTNHPGHVSMMDNHLPPPVPPGSPVNNGPVQTPWPPAGGVPGSVANPKMSVPPTVINEHPPKPADPQDHDCSIRQIVDGTGELLGGSATVAAGGVGVVAGATAEAPTLGTSTIPIIAGIGGIATGGKLITDGIDDLSHCTNEIVPGK